jgi:hypothetical protein
MKFLLSLASTTSLLVSVFQVTRITGVSHCAQSHGALLKDRNPSTFRHGLFLFKKQNNKKL